MGSPAARAISVTMCSCLTPIPSCTPRPQQRTPPGDARVGQGGRVDEGGAEIQRAAQRYREAKEGGGTASMAAAHDGIAAGS